MTNSVYLKYVIIVSVIILLFIFLLPTENFTPPPKASVYEFTDYTGYGDGYGDGYGLFGVIKGEEPKKPWAEVLKRMPKYIVTPYTPAPQIDYNTTGFVPSVFGAPESNVYVNIVDNTLAINGISKFTAQLDTNRVYYFNIFSPGMPFSFSLDGINPYPIGDLCQPSDSGVYKVVFDENLPSRIFYISPLYPGLGGIIYLNDI